MLDPTFFKPQNFVDPMLFLIQNFRSPILFLIFFYRKMLLNLKFFRIHKFLDQEFFWTHFPLNLNFFESNYFWTQHYLGPEFVSDFLDLRFIINNFPKVTLHYCPFSHPSCSRMLMSWLVSSVPQVHIVLNRVSTRAEFLAQVVICCMVTSRVPVRKHFNINIKRCKSFKCIYNFIQANQVNLLTS